MTDKEALKQARNRWGRKAVVKHWTDKPEWCMPYSVGIRIARTEYKMLGDGWTWEEAFADADRRAPGR